MARYMLGLVVANRNVVDVLLKTTKVGGELCNGERGPFLWFLASGMQVRSPQL